jgi:hypothetical protein
VGLEVVIELQIRRTMSRFRYRFGIMCREIEIEADGMLISKPRKGNTPILIHLQI